MEQKISYFVDTRRCPLRGYRSYNNSDNLFVITFKPYERIEIKENPEIMVMVHYNYYSCDYCHSVKHMFVAFNCQSVNELQLEKNWAIIIFSSSNPVPLRVDH